MFFNQNKRKPLHKNIVQFPEDWFGTPTWPPFLCLGTPTWRLWRHVKPLYIRVKVRFSSSQRARCLELKDTSNKKHSLVIFWANRQRAKQLLSLSNQTQTKRREKWNSLKDIYLRMMFAYISEQLMYEPTNKLSRSVNPGNQLWNNLQPSINLDCLDTVHKSFIHLRPMTVIEPKGQQSINYKK